MARALGKTLRELLDSTTSAELSEWMAFFRLERDLREEEMQRDALERDALRGAEEIRSEIRSR